MSWLLSSEGERSGFRVSICAGVVSPTSVDRCGWMRCNVCCVLQCSSDSWSWSPICCPDKGTIVNAQVTQNLGFHACSWTVCDQTLRALRLVLLLHGESTHTSWAALRPGTVVVKRSAGLVCVAVRPLGSAVMAGSASFMSQTTA